MSPSSLPYHEPSIIQVLILSTFGLLLNLANWVLERSIYCGLVGQILVGVLWGTPLAGWLDSAVEVAVVQLGYLGLILLVYEGGLSTSLGPLLSNLPLSTAVAITGILLPISLSFLLIPILPGTTLLQAFTAGAALSATSLGTTFSILTSSGFAQTRLGTVLTSAAMMDDVVGLVMIQVVAELGNGKVSGWAVGRPVGASLGLLVLVILGCRWVVGPVYRRFFGRSVIGKEPEQEVISRMRITGERKTFMVHSGILLALVTGASYAGTSVLFAAFLSGAAVSWWDKLDALPPGSPSPALTLETNQPQKEGPWTGSRVYEYYYTRPVQRILVPFFFASIGFSIPITKLFNGSTVWRGLVYALLMALGKFMTGLWLLRFSLPVSIVRPLYKQRLFRKLVWNSPTLTVVGAATVEEGPKNSDEQTTATSLSEPGQQPNLSVAAIKLPQKPRSLYPPAIIGLAMIARGEIGFLIASVAEARGIFSMSSTNPSGHDTGSSELYLVVIWATVLCTVLGPVAVGLCVRRVRALERERIKKGGSGTGVLGAWGVNPGSG